VGTDNLLVNEMSLAGPLLITASVGQIANYGSWPRIVTTAALSRHAGGVTDPIYIIAIENDVSTAQFAQAVLKEAINANPAATLVGLNVIALEAMVDRVCSAFSESAVRFPGAGQSQLIVKCEPFAHLCIDDRGDTAVLKSAIGHCGPEVTFTEHYPLEKLKKKLHVNGAHALAAVHAHFYGYQELHKYYSETDAEYSSNPSAASTPTPQARKDFLDGLLLEIAQAFREMAQSQVGGAKYLSDVFDTAEEDRYRRSICDRFSTTFDTTTRVLKEFKDDPAKLGPFLAVKVRQRIFEPYHYYCQRQSMPPPKIGEAILLMARAIGAGRFS